jgi:GNAT superfamily N-acetyltransferase
LGSIRSFPARPAASTLADVWRLAATAGNEALRVRPTRPVDYAAIRAVQREASPHVPPWSLRQLEAQVAAFPEGQMAAVAEGRICGAAASLLVTWSEYGEAHTWREITGDGLFGTHTPDGDTLYCAAAITDSTRRGFGIARALQQAQRRLCRRLNIPRLMVAARLEGYSQHASSMTPEDYAMRVVWGEIADPALRFRLSQGFQFCCVLRDYLPEDAESGGHAALLAWLYPLHAAPPPPASIVSERRRRVA